MINFINNKEKSLAGGGIGLLAIAALGIWAGNAYYHKYEYLISISAIVGLIGMFAICPLLIKIAQILLKSLWKLIKRVIYETFYAATKAIIDAKSTDRKSK